MNTWTENTGIIFLQNIYSVENNFKSFYSSYFWVLSQLRICTPPFRFSQCAETNEKNNYLSFIFRVIATIHRKLTIFGTKIAITRKIKIGNLIFLSIQPIPDLSCKFDYFWKKNTFYFFYFDVAYLSMQITEAWLGKIFRWR